jgi:hypothetical protein
MIDIKPVDYCYDEEYDSCGSTTVAILTVDRIKIPLCMNCLNELNESLSEFNNTIFCYMCEKFIMSKSGWKYGGSCRKDKDIELKDAGYINCVDCMYTCKDAIRKVSKEVS